MGGGVVIFPGKKKIIAVLLRLNLHRIFTGRKLFCAEHGQQQIFRCADKADPNRLLLFLNVNNEFFLYGRFHVYRGRFHVCWGRVLSYKTHVFVRKSSCGREESDAHHETEQQG